MPNTAEVATILVNGMYFDRWETVEVICEFHAAARQANFTVSEQVESAGPLTYSSLQIKPGDKCEVYLAGIKVMTGKVFGRQAAYDAGSHTVLISAVSDAQEAVHGSTPIKNTQFRGYGFEAIANNLLQPFGINLNMVNVPSYGTKPFKDVSPNPGEKVHPFLDRLAQLRCMFIRDDADGNMVVGGGSTTSAGDLVEGQNILAASCTVRNDMNKNVVGAIGQDKADDQTSGETARKSGASAQGNYDGYRPHILVSNEPGDSEDMQARADMQVAWLRGAEVHCTVTVQGWLKSGTPSLPSAPDSGALWDVEHCYTVTSPMLCLDSMLLGCQTVVFSQDNAGGTKTTLSMTLPLARTGPTGQVTAPAGDGSGVGGSEPSPAQPTPPDEVLST